MADPRVCPPKAKIELADVVRQLDEAASPRDGGAASLAVRGSSAAQAWVSSDRISLDCLAVVAGLSSYATKGYHNVKTQKPHDPGLAARRVGRREPTTSISGPFAN